MHTYLISGLLAQGGSVGDRELELTTVQNTNIIGNRVLEYIETNDLTLLRVVNVNDFDTITLDNITVTLLTVDPVVNVNTFDTITLAALPFVPENPETVELFEHFDETYPTSTKIQIDTLISELKDAGVWAKFDWYGNAYWALSEHDALLNWVDPDETLVKVGSPTWTMGAGLSGVSPTTSNSRYISGWNVGDGAHSSATNFAFFSKITAIAVPQNGLQPMGVWRRVTGGGPSTPNGVFLSLSTIAGTGFSGAWTSNGSGDGSFGSIGDATGMWGVTHSGASHATVKNGSVVASSTVLSNGSYTDPDGMSVAGSAGLAKRSFPGTQLYWGWGGALNAAEFLAIETAFQTALLPPVAIVNALIVNDDGDYLIVNDDGDYFQVRE